MSQFIQSDYIKCRDQLYGRAPTVHHTPLPLPLQRMETALVPVETKELVRVVGAVEARGPHIRAEDNTADKVVEAVAVVVAQLVESWVVGTLAVEVQAVAARQEDLQGVQVKEAGKEAGKEADKQADKQADNEAARFDFLYLHNKYFLDLYTKSFLDDLLFYSIRSTQLHAISPYRPATTASSITTA
ncbi:MAG: hypothetical protein M1824_001258 [Vezdaea acicularis]|nr:MAG: hypothetical protein M1824_001258 [Vezdaea acicularis]